MGAPNDTQKLDTVIWAFVATVFVILTTSKRRKIVAEMLTTPEWIAGVAAIVGFVGYYLIVDPKVRKRTTAEERKVKQGIVAGMFSFLLAIMAELHMTVPAFFIGFTAAFHYNA